jgi:hypothetical protein
MTPLDVNGVADERTVAAIRLFQRNVVQFSDPDGCIDPGGRTWRALNGNVAVAGDTTLRLSGAAWWHANQARFPNSAAVNDLEPDFAVKVERFISALRAGGAAVQVSATRRNKIRAYLMHYSWDITRELVRPAEVPAEPGCTIVWDHGDQQRSIAAARAMVDLFGVVFRPSLTSRHILGRAIDMTITWPGTIEVRDAGGRPVRLSSPGAASNSALHAIGASYGVLKLLSDPPHWSDNGH